MTQDRTLTGIGLMLAFCVLAPLLDIQATGFAGWLDKVLGKI